MEAIELANKGYWEAKVSLPDGVGYQGLTVAPVSAMIEQHHLETWITNEGEY
jgi:hypothetical protein